MLDQSERFLVWGAGGHGSVVADLVRCAGHSLCAFIDVDAGRARVAAEGVLDEVELFEELERRGHLPREATAIALGIGDNAARMEAFARIEPRYMPSLVHPRAVVAESVSVAPASVVLACAVVNANASLGRATIINSGAVVEHDCVVGDAVHVAPGAILTGGAQVDSRAWIGAGATVLPGISIGRDTVVGAGAVVTVDLPPVCTAVGVPARVIEGDEGSVHGPRD